MVIPFEQRERTQPVIPPNSFNFRNRNSLEEFGIKVIAADPFSAAKRPRDEIIPFRDGMYNHGREFYNQKVVKLECVLEKTMTKAEMREVIFWLSERGMLFLWDEPDKYYLGRLLASVDVDVFPAHSGRVFILPMVCQPFAFSTLIQEPLHKGINMINYEGTAETPTLIIIRNTSDIPIKNITLTLISRIGVT